MKKRKLKSHFLAPSIKEWAKSFKSDYHKLTPAREGELAVKLENWGWKPRRIASLLKAIKGKKYA